MDREEYAKALGCVSYSREDRNRQAAFDRQMQFEEGMRRLMVGPKPSPFQQQQMANRLTVEQYYQQRGGIEAEAARWDKLIGLSGLHHSPYLEASRNELLLLEEEC